MKLICIYFAIAIGLTVDCRAQIVRDSVASAASNFKINNGRVFWMGTNYRKEWNTPVKAPVLDMAKEKGGLKPVKLGGGKQTRSLHIEDASGEEYKIRSIKKFITSKTLPADLQSEAAEDIVADGVSASYPYAALSVPALSKAAGVPYLPAKLVYIPDAPELGEHRKDFRNLIAYVEYKHPESVKKSYDTEEVVKDMKHDHANSIDQQALLRARILDMYVMDFDRHEGQWDWGAVDKGNGKVYFPIPKDRDQAFYINQGVVPHMVQWAWLVPQLEGLKPKTKNIKRFNFAARNFDRFFLSGLSENDWKLAAEKFVSQMTDTTIEQAFEAQPAEIRNISADKIVKVLKERRKYLVSDVMEYYRFIAEIVDVYGSDKSELFEITRNDDGSVLLRISALEGEAGQQAKLYERLFDPNVTEELRLYGFGGEDKFVVNGNNDKIKIRMIGGKGLDDFENKGSSEGVILYDSLRENNKVTGGFKNKMSNHPNANSYDLLYYKYNQVIPFVSIGYNLDDGVFFGGYMKIIQHGFRKSPYRNSHTFTINRAIATKSFNFRYNADFIGALGYKTDLLFEADFKSPHITNFFGYGANSVYDKTKPGKFRYYWTRYRQGDFTLQLRKNFSSKVIMLLGPTFQLYKMDSTDEKNSDRNIVQSPPDGINEATVFAGQSYIGGRFALIADTRDHPVLPNKGIFWNLTVRHLAGTNKASYDVTQLNTDFIFYLSLIRKTAVLVNRTGYGHNFGDFEFYQAQYLGNEDNLRGYHKYRFAGHTKLYNNTELRIRLANFKTYLFPGSLGLLGYFDTGRIWADNDDSKKWLSGYGPGLWISPLSRLVFTATYAMSKETNLILVGLGWKF